jgi:hypothetical protein
MQALRGRNGRPGAFDPVLLPVLCPSRNCRGRDIEAAAEGAVIAQILRVGVIDVEGEAMCQALLKDNL